MRIIKSNSSSYLMLSTALVAIMIWQVGGAKAADSPSNTENVESVIVTGSAIPTTPGQVASTVTMVSAEDIAASGVSTNALDILRKQVPEIIGRGNTGAANANNLNQNTAGGSQLLLSNMDTLILINGRRAAVSAISAIGGKNFVDVNEIPAASIDHVEVLTEGSSTIYGSEAIGGVVNIITKTDYEGVQVGFRAGGAAGGYNEESAYFLAGTDWRNFDFTLSGSLSHNDPLFQRARSFSSPITGRVNVVPGTIGSGAGAPAILSSTLNTPSQTNPTGVNATAASLASLEANGTYFPTNTAGISSSYDISQFQTLLMRQGQLALDGGFSGNLAGDALSMFGDFEYSHDTSFTQFLPITSTLTVPKNAPFNPVAASISGVNFSDWARPKQFNNSQDAIRATVGFRGNFWSNWNWEIGFVHSDNALTQKQTNVIFSPNLNRAVAGGYDSSGNAVAGGSFSQEFAGFNNTASSSFVYAPALDPFARAAGLNKASLVNLYGTEVIRAYSALNSIDGKVTGHAFTLPAGDLTFALGASYREERLSAHTDPNGHNTGPTAQLWLGGTFADDYSNSRSIWAAFLEARAPIASAQWNVPGIYALDLIGAVRKEHYSDVGESLVPKISFRWLPLDEDLVIRGSYSKSFTAPTLFALNGPTDTRLVGSGVIQTVFGLANPGLQGEDGNNPGLKPSKSQSRTVSATYTPHFAPGLSLSLQYVAADQRGFPGGIGFTNILDGVNRQGASSPFAGNLAMNNFPGLPGAVAFTTPGQVAAFLQANPNNSLNLYAIDRFTNLGGIKTRAFNLSADYYYKTDQYGTFAVTTTGTAIRSFQFQALPSQIYYEYNATATNGGTGVQGTLPSYRFYSTVSWNENGWTAQLANTLVSAVTDIGPGGIVYANSTTLKPIHVPSYLAWDARFSYDGQAIFGEYGKGWSFAFGVNNFTDQSPPLAPQAFTDNNVDVSTYSPIGRFAYLQATVKF